MTKTFEELFDEKEREIIEHCIKFGNYTECPTQLDSHNCRPMTPERETALAEYINQHKQITIDEDSAVRAEMELKIASGELVIDSPEKEAVWQAKMDAEKAEKEAKLKAGTVELANSQDVAETDSVQLSKQEIMEKLKEKGIDFKPAQPKAELLDLLESQEDSESN